MQSHEASRRLFGSSYRGSQNLDHSLSQNNDEAEKQERRRRSLVEMVLSSSPRHSPDSFRNSFSSIANLNSAQLAEHFKNCMKLSNENKINARNAFQLQLIDYMAMMVKRKESEMDNFQIASCTLDASAKIYAYRVDNVHIDAVKMAGSLIRSDKKDKGNDKSNGEEEDEEGRATIKPTRKKRPCATVERNLKNLDCKEAESAFKIDPFFKRMAKKFDECQSGGCHFLANLKFLDETQEIILSSDRKWWRDPATVGENSNEMVSLPIPKFKAIQSAEVCPSFSNFTFNNWSPDNENSAFSELGQFCQDKILRRDLEYVFDMNAVPEPMDMSDVGEGMDVDHVPDESSGGTVEVMEFGRRSSGGSSVELIRNALSLSPQEYSYFKKGTCWAGPLHWKFKPLNKSYRTKAKRKRKQIVNTLAYEENPSDDFFKVSGKPVCLSDRTVANWDDLKITLPEDKHLSVSVLYNIY